MGESIVAAVARDATRPSLHEVLRDWQPGVVETARRVDPWSAAAFAALLDAEPPPLDAGAPLPALWHWFTLLEHPAQAEIGEDGHPAAGPFLPPIPGRRRMFAGGRLRQHGEIPIGADLGCRSSVAAVAVKQGRSGEMAFVTVRHELSIGGRDVAVEEQDIVYRSEPAGAPRRSTPRPSGGHPVPRDGWQAVLETDPVLLARFSALTYNGHRIHYDRPYATEVELYPDLVVHGPLLALLALELPRPRGRTVEAFEYRLVRPAFLPDPILASARPDEDRLDIIVGARGAEPSLTATAHLR